MILRTSRIVLAFFVGVLTFSTSCHHVNAKQLEKQVISLSYNGGTCQQNGQSGIVDILPDQLVVFQGASAVSQFEVDFAKCPFGTCPVKSPTGAPANAGQPAASATGKTFNYTGLTIDNKKCNLVSPMGLRIRPGP